jgi:hypothetical protein
VIDLAAGLFGAVSLTLGGLLLQTAARLRDARRNCAEVERLRAATLAILDTVPLSAFRWRAAPEDNGYSVRTSPYPRFLAELVADDAAKLEAARQSLQASCTSFSLTVELRTGGTFVVEGRRVPTGETVLWLLDASAAALGRQAAEEAASLRELISLDHPLPLFVGHVLQFSAGNAGSGVVEQNVQSTKCAFGLRK